MPSRPFSLSESSHRGLGWAPLEVLHRRGVTPVRCRHDPGAALRRLPHVDGLCAVAARQAPRRRARPVQRKALVPVRVAAQKNVLLKMTCSST